MENEIIKMVRKHPIASVLLVIALAVPYSIELFLSNWKNLVSIGISMVIGTSCLFSILAICLWGIVYLITVSIKNIMKKNKKIHGGKLQIGIWELPHRLLLLLDGLFFGYLLSIYFH
jgi:hypothetical protein